MILALTKEPRSQETHHRQFALVYFGGRRWRITIRAQRPGKATVNLKSRPGRVRCSQLLASPVSKSSWSAHRIRRARLSRTRSSGHFLAHPARDTCDLFALNRPAWLGESA